MYEVHLHTQVTYVLLCVLSMMGGVRWAGHQGDEGAERGGPHLQHGWRRRGRGRNPPLCSLWRHQAQPGPAQQVSAGLHVEFSPITVVRCLVRSLPGLLCACPSTAHWRRSAGLSAPFTLAHHCRRLQHVDTGLLKDVLSPDACRLHWRLPAPCSDAKQTRCLG